jgi:hypothetical protein
LQYAHCYFIVGYETGDELIEIGRTNDPTPTEFDWRDKKGVMTYGILEKTPPSYAYSYAYGTHRLLC